MGMTQEGFQYFQKAWSNLIEFSPSTLKDNQDLVKQKGVVSTGRGLNLSCFSVKLLGCSYP